MTPQEKLRVKIQSMPLDELVEAIVLLVPKRYKTRGTAQGYISTTKHVRELVDTILATYPLEDFFHPDLGFLPGLARDLYALSYCNLYGSAAQMGRPLASEALTYEAFAAARKYLESLDGDA